MRKFYTVYQTNKENIFGGYCTYDSLSEAFDSLDVKNGINKIWCVTIENTENELGTPYLCREFSRGLVYSVA
jgi:hypothetical protein